jgi:putative endonuclease
MKWGSRKESGAGGERAAERMLEGKGYQILERNFLVRGGEIDLVAWKGGMLVFVEVKARKGGNFGSPAEGVDLKKRKRLELAAKVFLLRYKDSPPACRFDLVEVGNGADGRVKVGHMPDAFRPGWEES